MTPTAIIFFCALIPEPGDFPRARSPPSLFLPPTSFSKPGFDKVREGVEFPSFALPFFFVASSTIVLPQPCYPDQHGRKAKPSLHSCFF